MTTKTKQGKSINLWGRTELLKLPMRAWNKESEYSSLLLLSTRRKHDSGWAMMAIIGVRGGVPVEIACACCDVIAWKLPAVAVAFPKEQMRMDCALRSGALHTWAPGVKFRVGLALSSTDVELLVAERCRRRTRLDQSGSL